MSITFGVSLPSRGLLASPDNLKTTALLVDKFQYESGWVSDHIVIPRSIDSKYPYSSTGASPFSEDQPYFEPISALNFLAGCTNRLKLGTHVLIVPYRNPVLTAKMLATLDYLSEGRLIVGVGVGWMKEEFEALGLDHYAARGIKTDEYLSIYKSVWMDEPSMYNGTDYAIDNVGFSPKPFQTPHPPLWIGGHSKPALRRAAKFGDAWMPIGQRPPAILDPNELSEKYKLIQEMAVDNGRSENSVDLCFSSTISFRDEPDSRDHMMTGIPEQIAADIRLYQDVGVQNFILSFNSEDITELHECIQRFAEDVISLIPR